MKRLTGIMHYKKGTMEMLCLFGIFLLFIPMYIQVVRLFSYSEYYKYTGIDAFRFLGGTAWILFLIIYKEGIYNKFLKSVYVISLILYMYGEVCIYICDLDVDLTMIVIISAFLLAFRIIDRINFEMPPALFDMKKMVNIFFLITLVLFLPFLRYLTFINLKNLMLQGIYETRNLFENINSPAFLSYMSGSLSRVLLPILIIVCIENKRKILLVISGAMLIYLFLCGGVKSIFLGLLCTVFFYKGDYSAKTRRFLYAIFAASLLSLILLFLFDYRFIIDYLRRIFFIPPRFNLYYINYFRGNWTYYLHSGFAVNKDPRLLGMDISHFVGRYVMGTGTNANTGIFVEGYYSFGLLGAILYLIIPLGILFFLKSLNYDKKYFGLVFVYLYVQNTAIFSTMLLSHGLMLFLILSFLFLRERKRTTECF